jgi:hypothetical protein
MPLAARAAANRASSAIAGATAKEAADIEKPPALEPPPPSSQPSPDSPPGNAVPAAKGDNKKSSRSHKKKGRNQYMRDREGNEEPSPARSQSRDTAKDEGPTANVKSAVDHNAKSNSRPKTGISSKITMSEMKRRAAVMLDFISRTQLELAGEALPGAKPDEDETAAGPRSVSSKPANNGGQSFTAERQEENAQACAPNPKDFKDLGCMGMMDSLTRRLVKWQQEYCT